MSTGPTGQGSSYREGESHSSPIRNNASTATSLVDNHGSGSSVGSSWAPGTSGRSSHRESSVEPIRPSSARRTAEATEDHPLSFQDRVVQAAGATGSSALFGTLGLLKLAGGATLSTTGKIIHPSIQVTRQVILPALLSALTEYISSISPQRLKDWFRIIRSSLYHFITVLKNTHKGIVFRQKVLAVGADVVDCFSSDASRQLIVDGMATLVKLSEALNTPETKTFIDQTAVLGSRLVDVAASGRNKLLLKDAKDAVWAFCQLASDPSTTLAMAEVTACLCHALEMEEAIHRNQTIPNHLAAQRRYERNQFQRQTCVDPDTMQDPETTVEEVILSSLGGFGGTEQGTLPNNLVFEHYPTETRTSGTDSEMDVQPQDDWKNAGRDAVDMEYLHQMISLRAGNMERQRLLRTTVTTTANKGEPSMNGNTSSRQNDELLDDIEDVIVETVHDDEHDNAVDVALRRQGTKKHANLSFETKASSHIIERDESSESGKVKMPNLDAPPLANIDGEQATTRFFRCLDELMKQKRAEAVSSVLGKSESGKVWYPRAAAAAGAGNERGQDTLKNRLYNARANMRSAIGVGGRAKSSRLEQSMTKTVHENIFTMTFVALIGLFALMWFFLGCYGLYVIAFGPPKTGVLNLESLFSMLKPSPAANEVVIRIVREVVYVDSKGDVIQQMVPDFTSTTNLNEIAECVAASTK